MDCRLLRPAPSIPSPLIQPATAGIAPEVIGRPRVSDTQLYLSGVSVSFDGFRAINNLSLMVAPGELRTIIGPNGAGKTTMMDIVTGKTRPDERSEEHTSELQSLMRISYAVFCLKKKNKIT